MNVQDEFQVVSNVVRRRKTVKVMTVSPRPFDERTLVECDQLLGRCIADSGWAPFHFNRGVEGLPEPWRIHWLRVGACRELAAVLPKLVSDIRPDNRMSGLLTACGSALLITWLPQTSDEVADEEKLRQMNDEHLAATAALVQNLLLLTEAAGFGTFWSSGGLVRNTSVLSFLQVPEAERLLAMVYVDYQRSVSSREVELIEGKQRAKRSGMDAWCRQLDTLPTK